MRCIIVAVPMTEEEEKKWKFKNAVIELEDTEKRFLEDTSVVIGAFASLLKDGGFEKGSPEADFLEKVIQTQQKVYEASRAMHQILKELLQRFNGDSNDVDDSNSFLKTLERYSTCLRYYEKNLAPASVHYEYLRQKFQKLPPESQKIIKEKLKLAKLPKELGSYLMVPAQRLPMYHLMTVRDKLVKYAPKELKDSLSGVLKSVIECCVTLDNKIKKMDVENLTKIYQIQGKIDKLKDTKQFIINSKAKDAQEKGSDLTVMSYLLKEKFSKVLEDIYAGTGDLKSLYDYISEINNQKSLYLNKYKKGKDSESGKVAKFLNGLYRDAFELYEDLNRFERHPDKLPDKLQHAKVAGAESEVSGHELSFSKKHLRATKSPRLQESKQLPQQSPHEQGKKGPHQMIPDSGKNTPN